MVKGMHGMSYASDAAGLREFFRDQLGFSADDIGGGWLIKDMPSADLGVHPRDTDDEPPAATADLTSFCDDIHATMRELAGRGVAFAGEPEEHSYGLVSYILAPEGIRIQPYQPHYGKG